MATIEYFDWRNVTYRKTLEFERIWHEAISDDPLRRGLLPSRFQFSPQRQPPIHDYEDLIQRAKTFKCLVESDARNFEVRIRSDPRLRIAMLKDAEGRYGSVCFWILPQYVPRPHIPLLHRLKTWFMARWYALRNWWTLLGQPQFPTTIRGVLDGGREMMRIVNNSAERVAQLQAMSPKELEETTYPADDAYYLGLFATRVSAHGHGYGKRLLNESLQALAPYVPPPRFAGPPKAVLHASPPARPFYEKNGFVLGTSVMSTLPNGEPYEHNYYFRNLKPS